MSEKYPQFSKTSSVPERPKNQPIPPTKPKFVPLEVVLERPQKPEKSADGLDTASEITFEPIKQDFEPSEKGASLIDSFDNLMNEFQELVIMFENDFKTLDDGNKQAYTQAFSQINQKLTQIAEQVRTISKTDIPKDTLRYLVNNGQEMRKQLYNIISNLDPKEIKPVNSLPITDPDEPLTYAEKIRLEYGQL
jgi:hypothetical protein